MRFLESIKHEHMIIPIIGKTRRLVASEACFGEPHKEHEFDELENHELAFREVQK